MSEPTHDRTRERFNDLATAVAPAVLTPGFDEVHRSARRRRTRRTSAVTLAVVAGLVLVASTPSMLGLKPAETLNRVTGGLLGEPQYRGGGYSADFVTPSIGYRSLTRCPVDPVPCKVTLEATSDGGRTWQSRPVPSLPRPAKDGRNDPRVQVLGSQSLLLISGDTRQLSADGGRHWAAAPSQTAEPVDAAAPTDLVVLTWSKAGPNRLVVVERSTGSEAPLRTQPPVVHLDGVQRGTDGSLWAWGRDAAEEFVALVSHDGGRTWMIRTVAGLKGVTDTSLRLLTVDGRTAYALNLAVDDDATELPIARTVDGGLTWRTLAPVQGLTPSAALDAALLPDGRLAITQQQPHPGLFVSSDAVNFERVPGVPGMFPMIPFAGGILGYGDRSLPGDPRTGYRQQPGTQLYMTTDGKTWRPLPLWDVDF